ncbi:MAG TPA: glutaredoxin [Alphaproteobacteria bacterium]|nr:glutaredoxin [Alphaproteobacteria bacterium]HAM48656.1 glutaredoxin [Alphaproteobacteria bacterium]HBA44072.1 glutaredoxin [Alphaproteobacteria bacterium]HBC55295.1 glutaredoxin [Alphaproteobacteria bacterium]HBF97936.1 glutaredoxin [Alphaproteobacteria bacterium]
METDDHICPFGLKSKDLLERRGFKVEDHILDSRAAQEAFKAAQQVETTPQTFIGTQRIGGYDALREYFGEDVPDEDAPTYQPVIAIFAIAALMALALAWAAFGGVMHLRTVEWFVAISMCLLAVQKLRDVAAFSNSFLGYDLLARRHVRYAYVYPFGEALAGILMLAGELIWLAAPVAAFIGCVGAISVIKAVYIDKRDIKCACVGGNSNVPLGFVSLTENLMMFGMAMWMTLKGILL